MVKKILIIPSGTPDEVEKTKVGYKQ